MGVNTSFYHKDYTEVDDEGAACYGSGRGSMAMHWILLAGYSDVRCSWSLLRCHLLREPGQTNPSNMVVLSYNHTLSLFLLYFCPWNLPPSVILYILLFTSYLFSLVKIYALQGKGFFFYFVHCCITNAYKGDCHGIFFHWVHKCP